ncbi:ABC transporter ATP-binding protein [Paenarthrobacter aurescens]|uniref:ABC transporter ATP-binding protein n=1 Tax=Paenarthrobacter aurescens TaxID=43663 RepID=UPI0021C109A5|nr:ABC transporter ATP-binding protein [Paenarthrobacter aurescens]MCT9868229.1 ABC transporter ATP-binding protein [Paenarthrobacter aurescens]
MTTGQMSVPAAPERPAIGAPAVIEAVGLTKTFGKNRALNAMNLEVPEGSIFGFLGLNGAGKTTFLRVMSGLSRASSGSLRLLGEDATLNGTSIRHSIGYLPDVPAFYEWMNARQTLHLAGRLFGLDGPELDAKTEELLDFVRLSGIDQPIGKYSRGMRQRLGVAQALINSPRLLLLDEPTSALDPEGRRELLDFIGALRGKTTVFFSTHILSDVERICDSVAILDKGRVLAQSTMEELRSRRGQRRILIDVSEGAEALAGVFGQQDWAVSVQPGPRGEIEVRVSDTETAQREIPLLIGNQGLGLIRMENAESGLEEVFLELVGKGNQ